MSRRIESLEELLFDNQTIYHTRSKNSSTLKFVRQKSFVQVDANCDKFPVSLIPVKRL